MDIQTAHLPITVYRPNDLASKDYMALAEEITRARKPLIAPGSILPAQEPAAAAPQCRHLGSANYCTYGNPSIRTQARM